MVSDTGDTLRRKGSSFSRGGNGLSRIDLLVTEALYNLFTQYAGAKGIDIDQAVLHFVREGIVSQGDELKENKALASFVEKVLAELKD